MRVSVDLSPVQFKHGELVGTIEEVLAEAELEPDRLELEITESVLLNDTKSSLEMLSCLKDLSVKFAMDDFGTGYSSLGYLNSFPFDKIKIDKSFISELDQREKVNAIGRSVINLGQSLGMITNADGVETLQQLTFLTAEGCEQVQGYYFGQAMPADEVTSLIDGWARAPASGEAA